MKKILWFVNVFLMSLTIVRSQNTVCLDTLFYEPFANNLGQMSLADTVNGTWIYTATCANNNSVGHSAPGAAIFSGNGCVFDNPNLTVSGAMHSPMLILPVLNNPSEKIILEFNTFIKNECGTNNICPYDVLQVEISKDSGQTFQILASSDNNLGSSSSGWFHYSIDISSYAQDTVLIRFYFNSIDDYDNNYDGIYIDDIFVSKNIQGFVNINDTIYCVNSPADTLEFCAPSGYLLNGPGINGNVFDPMSAGKGNHWIYLGYNDTLVGYSVQTGLPVSWDTTPGTSVVLGDDDISAPISLNFNFDFFGTTYNQIQISSNGFLAFPNQTNDGCCSGQSLPDPLQPNNLIAFAWADLDPTSGGTVRYALTGSAPNQVFVVTFDSVRHCCGSAADTVIVQIKLYESTNVIEIHSIKNTAYNSTPQTMGLENAAGNYAVTIPGRNANSNFSVVNEMTRFTPSNSIINFVKTDSIHLYVMSPDPVILTNTPVCEGGYILLNEQNPASVSWMWTGPAGFTSTQQNPAIFNATLANEGYYSVQISDSMGCIGMDSVFVDVNTCTGVDEIYVNEFKFYPNPAHDRLNVEWQMPQKGTIECVGIDGRQHLKVFVAGETKLTLDIKSLESGIYILKFIDNQGNEYRAKWIKSN